MILADTSAWVEYDRATGSAVHRRVAELIATDGPLSVTEPPLTVELEREADGRWLAEVIDLPAPVCGEKRKSDFRFPPQVVWPVMTVPLRTVDGLRLWCCQPVRSSSETSTGRSSVTMV